MGEQLDWVGWPTGFAESWLVEMWPGEEGTAAEWADMAQHLEGAASLLHNLRLRDLSQELAVLALVAFDRCRLANCRELAEDDHEIGQLDFEVI